MNIKSAFSIFLTTFMLCGFFTLAPAQSAPMPEAAGQVAEDLTVDVFVIEVDEDPVKERIIFEQDVIEDVRTVDGINAPNAIAPLIKPPITKPFITKPPRVDPYTVIEAARHSKGERRAYSLPDIRQLGERLDMAVVDAKSRLPELKRIGLSPVEKLRDHLNQMQQTITLKVSRLLERVGRSATDTAQQLRESR